MAFIEQMIGGLGTAGGRPSAILARSPGLTREVAGEAMGLLTGWDPPLGPDPAAAAFLLAPLQAGLPGAPGRVYVAARARGAVEERRLVHALFLGQDDMAAFGFSPYRLEREGLYLDAWAPGLILERLDRQPGSLAALVSPLPDQRDADLLDEALRQYFASGRLVIPLAEPDAAVDRFFALLLECLPGYIRREMLFASLSPAGPSQFTVGGVFMPGGSFQAWQGSLLSAVRRPLPAELEDHLATVRRHVAAGDLLSLAAVARALDRAPAAGRRAGPAAPRPEALASTVTRQAEPVPEMLVWQRSRPAVAALGAAPPAPTARSRATAAPARRTGRDARLWLALAGVAGALAVVLALLTRPGPRSPAPAPPLAAAGATAAAPAATAPSRAGAEGALGGVIDVSALYESELEAFARETGAPGAEDRRLQAGAEALAALRQRGGDDLRRQARDFLAAAARDLESPDAPEREAGRARALQAQGEELARELRRLVLATYAFGRGEPWSDLGGLDDARLAARSDSLRRRDPERLRAAARELEVEGLAERIAAAAAGAGARGGLAELLARARIDDGWPARLAEAGAAIDSAATAGRPRLAAWRQAALALARVKQAEAVTGFAATALDPRGAADGLPPLVEEALRGLREALDDSAGAAAPPLARAVLDCHDDLGRLRELAAARAATDELLRLFAALDANRALAFDPGVYADHVTRARLDALAGQLAQGRPPGAIPLALFPGENRQETLAVLQLEQTGGDAAAWTELAGRATVPFLSRWARGRAIAPEPALPRAPDPFDADFQRLVLGAARLAAETQRGHDWTADFVDLRDSAERFRREHPPRPSASAERRERTARAEALLAALDAPLSLVLERVTVTLAAGQLSAPAEVVVELAPEGPGDGFRTPAILMQRTGTGAWRGERTLDATFALRPARALRAVVSRVADGRALAVVRYGEDAATAAPGALLRPGAGPGPDGGPVAGTLTFDAPDWFWRRLAVPDLREPVAWRAAGDGASLAGR